MPVYRVGSVGDEVRQIQTQLHVRNLYLGPIDGIYGGGTEAAVRAFQTQGGLTVDGMVGGETWAALFGAGTQILPPAIASRPLDERCLALTGTFETDTPPPECFAGLSGDFDGMGMSFGALQWNFGSGSIQPILRQFDAANPAVITRVFGGVADEFRSVLASTTQEQLDWARSIQTARFAIVEPWRGYFKTLGRDSLFIQAEVATINATMAQARGLCVALNVTSQRALALAFDIMTQDGGIPALTMRAIQQDTRALSAQLAAQDLEQAKLVIIANRRADAAKPQWREDVRRRKLTIAQGSGTVHGRFYDLAGQFGITLAPM